MVRMILNSHFTLINTGGACIEGKQVWAHVMIMLSEWYFSFFINHDYMNSILIYGVCLLWYLMNWFVMRLSGITIVIELAPPPHPLPQLEYIYQARELGCRMVGFSIICSRAQLIKIRNCKCFFVYCNKTNVSIIKKKGILL